MASGPITSWQIDGETVADFILGGSKITADGDCSLEIKRRLLLERNFMTNLDSILKSKDITLSTKVHLVKAMVFLVVMYGCESWTIKKAERRRVDAFEVWCGEDSWESLGLQGHPTSPSWRKSVLNIHWRDWYWSWNSNTLATWCKVLTHWKTPWCWERLRAGGGGDDKGWDGWLASPTQRTWVWVNSGNWWWTGRPGVQGPRGHKESGTTEGLNWLKMRTIAILISPALLQRLNKIDVSIGPRTQKACDEHSLLLFSLQKHCLYYFPSFFFQ